MEKAIILLEDYKRAERELNNFMEINSTIDDLEIVSYNILYVFYIKYLQIFLKVV